MSPSQVAFGLDQAGADIAVGVSGLTGNQIAGMRDDTRTGTGGQASVGSAVRDGAGDRRTPRPPLSYGHAPADGRNPARRALLDSQPATDRPRTGLYQDTMA